MSVYKLPVSTAADAALARAAARRACAEAQFEAGASAQVVLAISRLADPFLIGAGRSGAIRIEVPCSDGRPGLELEARLRCAQWGVDLPPIAELVDEIDAGFTPNGELRVWGRKRRAGLRSAPPRSARAGRPSAYR